MEQSGVGSPISLSETCPAYLSGIVPGKQQPIVPRQGLGNAARGALRDRLCRGARGAPAPGGCRDRGRPPSPAGLRGAGAGPAGRPVREP